jgi:hypothetical protein
MAFWVKGVVFSGMFMGIISTIAIWVLVLKSPKIIQKIMSKHTLIADCVLSSLSISVLSALGPGTTVFMAMITQMVLLSFLLETLEPH